jgi:hypothetical protein
MMVLRYPAWLPSIFLPPPSPATVISVPVILHTPESGSNFKMLVVIAETPLRRSASSPWCSARPTPPAATSSPTHVGMFTSNKKGGSLSGLPTSLHPASYFIAAALFILGLKA